MSSARVKPGYKLTELGVIPEDWSISQLQDVAKLSGGSTPSRSMFDLYFKSGTNNWVKTTDLNNTWINYTEEKITDIAVSQTNLNIYPKNTVFVAMYGGFNQIGRTGILNIPAASNQALIAIQSKQHVLSPIYLLSYLNFNVDYWKTVASSSRKDPNITSKDVKEFLVPLPPLPEQKAIAAALSDVDALITAQEALIAKKRDIKTATMQQLLTGKVRLTENGQRRVDNGGAESLSTVPCSLSTDSVPPGYQQTELGVIPADWDIVSLGEIGQSIIGLTYKPENTSDYGTLVLRSSNVQNGKLAYEDNVFVNMELPSRVIVEEDDILICVRNGSRQLIGKCALIDKQAAGSAFGAFMSIYRSKYSKFIFFQFQSTLIQNQINEIMGATINQITNKDMAAFRVFLPKTTEEQDAIVEVLSDMDAEITALEAQRDKTRAIKQGMMQELLTGKTRLLGSAA